LYILNIKQDILTVKQDSRILYQRDTDRITRTISYIGI
jgi:hypothetical protein